MAVVTFIIAGLVGILGTSVLVARLFRRRPRSNHQVAGVAALGLALTWFAALSLPVLVESRREPATSFWILAAATAIGTLVFAYFMARLLLGITTRSD